MQYGVSAQEGECTGHGKLAASTFMMISGVRRHLLLDLIFGSGQMHLPDVVDATPQFMIGPLPWGIRSGAALAQRRHVSAY